jgi:hypothetical protein
VVLLQQNYTIYHTVSTNPEKSKIAVLSSTLHDFRNRYCVNKELRVQSYLYIKI